MTSLARPYVLLSVASSIDGYIDDATDTRLLLSNDEDFDRVDAERAAVDAILVGANTIRADNPRLLVRSEQRRATRRDNGLPESPVKVTVSATGDLDPQARFFTTGDVTKLVYTTTSNHAKAHSRVGHVATVVDAGDSVTPAAVLADLAQRGITKLMVEGGGSMHTQFLAAGVADEIHLVLAPFVIGDPAAPRFLHNGPYPQSPNNPMTLADVQQIGNVVLLRYLTTHAEPQS